MKILHFIISYSLCFVLGMVTLVGQNGQVNPFELRDTIPDLKNREQPAPTARLSTENNPFELSDTIPAASTEVRSPSSAASNPFDLNKPAIPQEPTPEVSSTNPFDLKEQEQEENVEGREKEQVKVRKEVSKDLSPQFKLWLIIIMTSVLTLLVTLYNSELSKMYRAFLNENFLKMIQRDHGTVIAIPYLILYFFAMISIGIFLFVLLEHYNHLPLEESSALVNLGICIAIVLGLLALKHLVLGFISVVFPISKEIKQYSFTILIFGILSGLILVPASILITYVPEGLTMGIIYATLIVLGLLYLYRILRGLFISGRHLSLHPFHFFVYLCTIEIAPLLLILKATGGL